MIENNYVVFKTPKLLNIKKGSQLSSYNQNINDIEKKNKEIQKRIQELDKIHKENMEEYTQEEIDNMKANFYKNPFKYMEYLAKKYFIENANTLENLKIKKEMTNNFQKICFQIEEHIRNYTTNEERKLNELRKTVENKLKGDSIPFNEDIIGSSNSNKENKMNIINNKNSNNFNNLQSSPITMEDEEFLNRVLGYQGPYGSSKDGIISSGNAVNFVKNDTNSKLNEDNLYLNALSCLKGNKLIAPKNKFIAVKELSLNDVDQKKIKDTQNIIDLKNQMKIEEYNNEIMGNIDKNNKKIKTKINSIKKNEKKNLEDLISYSNNHINNMKQFQKEKNDLINNLKKKLNREFESNAIKLAMDKLSICEQNLNQIKSDKNYNSNYKNIPENSLIDWKERKEILEKEYNDTQTMVNNFLKGRGASLNKPVKKGITNKNKKKKRNNSAFPYNKKNYYNYQKY